MVAPSLITPTTQLQALDRGNPTCCLSAYNDDDGYNLAEMAARCLAMVARVARLRCVLPRGLSQPLYTRLGLDLLLGWLQFDVYLA